MRGRVVDERAREVALHTTDEVVVFCMRALPTDARRIAAAESVADEEATQADGTHETIPNAWYSMMEEREIRARSPCCMPRSKRRMATFGDGCSRGGDA